MLRQEPDIGFEKSRAEWQSGGNCPKDSLAVTKNSSKVILVAHLSRIREMWRQFSVRRVALLYLVR